MTTADLVGLVLAGILSMYVLGFLFILVVAGVVALMLGAINAGIKVTEYVERERR